MSQPHSATALKRDFGGKPFRSLCYAPFVQLSFMTDGSASACCMSRVQPLGNVREQRLREIWNGDRARTFRDQLAAFEFPRGCVTCQRSLDAGRIDGHPLLDYDHFDVDDTLRWPKRLEFAMSNVCNLGCLHCSGELSSVIRAKEGLPALRPAYDETFFDDLQEFLPRLEGTSFLGGEPFLQRECHRVWSELIALRHPGVAFITTNGTVWNTAVENVLESLNVRLAVSIDGVSKETVEDLRVNAQFDRLMENISRFADVASRRGFRLQLNFCLMRRNWHEVADFFRFAESLGAAVWCTVLTHPEHHSLLTLPQADLIRVTQTIENASASLTSELLVNEASWASMLRELQGHARASRLREADHARRQGEPQAVPLSPMPRAWQLLEARDLDGALAAAMETPVTDPNYYYGLLLCSEIHTIRQRLDVAEGFVDEAMRLASRHPAAFARRAWIRYQQRRFEEGLVDSDHALEKAARIDTTPAWVWDAALLAKAVLLERLARHTDALAVLDELARHNPDHPQIAVVRDRIRSRFDAR